MKLIAMIMSTPTATPNMPHPIPPTISLKSINQSINQYLHMPELQQSVLGQIKTESSLLSQTL